MSIEFIFTEINNKESLLTYIMFVHVLNQHQQFTSYIVNRLKLVGWVTTKLFFYKIIFIRGHKCHVMQKVISAVFAMAMQ